MTRVSDDRPVAIEGVLFDMDGTLSDTEPFWFEAEQLIVTRYGTGPVTDRAAHRVGASMDADAAFLQEHSGRDRSPATGTCASPAAAQRSWST